MIFIHINIIDIPDPALSCVAFDYKIQKDQIMNLLDNVINILNECACLTIPLKVASSTLGIPGWNEYIQPLKDKSCFGNACGGTGCPAQGPLADLRRHTCRKYHWAIKLSYIIP